MDFGEALRVLKAGGKVTRAGWNGKGQWVSLSGPLGSRDIPASAFWSHNNREFAESQGGHARVQPCLTLKTAQGEIQMGWLATQSDLLADDWMFAEATETATETPPL